MRSLQILLLAVVSFQFLGCASITGSKYQSVNVVTICDGKQVSGASCTLTNDSGTWYGTTPSSLSIHKSTGDISVTCKLNDSTGVGSFASTSTTSIWGNILMGGPIGAAIDAGTGAGFDYPQTMNISLDKCPTDKSQIDVVPKSKK